MIAYLSFVSSLYSLVVFFNFFPSSPPSLLFLNRNLSGIATCGFFSRDCLYSFLSLPDTGKIDYGDLTFPRNRSFVFLGANQVRLQKVTYSNLFMTSILEAQKPGRTVNYSAEALGKFGSEERRPFVWDFAYSFCLPLLFQTSLSLRPSQ